jgi:nicotinate-nucleotide adenylyltransferase
MGMVRLGLLGGTFDPIHLGHLLLAETAHETLRLTQVLFVPAGDPPHKQHVPKTPAQHRQAMVELAIAGNPGFALSLIDLERPGPHYSTDTISLLRAQYHLAADDCFLIIGGDSLGDLPTWHDAAKLITQCRLAVSRRPGYQPDLKALEATLPGVSAQLNWVDMPALGLVASDIRARAQNEQSIRYQVTDKVRQYIEQHQLYTSQA